MRIDQNAKWYFQMSTYLDMILKVFKMGQSKKEFLAVLQGVSIE